MGEMIRMDEIGFEYQQEGQQPVQAINGVSLTIEAGSFTAVIGENGSGKSTLAKNMNALLLPVSGAVYVKGYDTKDEEYLWKIRQSAAMVFQNPDNQIVSSIVEDDVAFGPENLGVPPKEIRARVDQALKAVHMYEHRGKAPHLLSGGQKQRIAIAGAIAMRPECIIFDEPTAMLDPQGRNEVLATVKELNREGITIVLITHFMEEAAQADRIIIMDRGKVALDGTPESVFSREEKIRELNLDLPLTVDLCRRLRARGISIPKTIISPKEMVEFLCQYKSIT